MQNKSLLSAVICLY